MAQIFKNNVWGQLASELASGATTATLNAGHGFTDPGTDWYLATLIGVTGTTETAWEIVKVTDVSTNTLTIVRAQEGTTAVTWPVGTRIELRLTAGATESKANLGNAAYANVADSPTDGATTAPISSNWAYDHAAATAAHGVSGAVVGTTDQQTLTNKTLTNPAINGFTSDTSVINIGSGQIYKDASGNLLVGKTTATAGFNGIQIGTTTSGKSLLITASIDGADGLLQFIDKNGSDAFQIAGTSISSFLYSYSTRPLEFYTNGTKRVSISGVDGGVTVSSLSGTGGPLPVYVNDAGRLQRGSSDARLKENITSLSDCLTKTLNLNPVSFQWRDKANMGAYTNIGFIAQDMETVVPEVVGSNSDGMKSIDYPKLVALLTGAIQEQQALIEQLNLRISALEGA